jgi:TRAP transporter TAXI family solute receptor
LRAQVDDPRPGPSPRRQSGLAIDLRANRDAAGAVHGRSDHGTHVITFVVGHPSELISDAIERCNTILISIGGSTIGKVVNARPYYRRSTIPAGLYRGANSDTRTFGVSATLVTTSKLDPAAAYAVTQAVFQNFEKFSSMHPALRHLNKVEMAKTTMTAPLHDGAKKYFEETGLIK